MEERKEVKHCPYAFCPEDDPTKVNHLGFRAAVVFITWAVLGLGIKSGNGFFISLTLFAITLFIDYLKFNPPAGWRKVVKYIEIALSVIVLLVGIIGLIGILTVKIVNNIPCCSVSEEYIVFTNASFPISFLWMSLAITVLFSLIDWAAYSSPAEKYILSSAEA